MTCITGNWRSTPTVDAINVTTNQNILLTGIGLYKGPTGAGYEVDVEISQDTTSLFKKRLTVPPTTGDENQLKVSMNEPIFIQTGIVYSVKALSHGNIGHFGGTCQAVCTKGEVTFTFTEDQQSRHTNPTNGQIPRLYFCF